MTTAALARRGPHWTVRTARGAARAALRLLGGVLAGVALVLSLVELVVRIGVWLVGSAVEGLWRWSRQLT